MTAAFEQYSTEFEAVDPLLDPSKSVITLLSPRLEFVSSSGQSYVMDVIEGFILLSKIRAEHADRQDLQALGHKLADAFSKLCGFKIGFSEAWQIMEHLTRAWNEFKKKQLESSGSQTNSGETPSPSPTANTSSTRNSPLDY